MTKYVAIINTPGYLPTDDDPPTFDTAREAWKYLAQVRFDDVDNSESFEEFDDLGDTDETYERLAVLGTEAHWQMSGYDHHERRVEWLALFGISPDGTGTVHGPTPGYEGDHDLGLAYSVQVAEEEEPRLAPQRGPLSRKPL